MSNAIIGALRIVLGLDSAAFEKGVTSSQKTLNKAAREWKTTGEQLTGLGKKMSLAFTAPFAVLAVQSSKAATESAQALGQVEAGLKSMNGASGKTVEQLQAIAGGLQDISLYDDDDILKSVTANLLTFGNISGDVFDRAEQSIVDMSARLGQDLQSSTIQLGKALNDPIKGITALRKVGVSFTEDQQNQIKVMVKHGETVKAQGLILDEVAREFSGSAKAMRDADPFAALAETGRNFAESFGAIINKAIRPLADWAQKGLDAFNEWSPEMQAIAVGFAATAAATGPLLIVLGALITSTGTVFSTMATLAPMIAAVRTAWVGYMASVAALGPVQATAAAGATALGAAIDFALGPIGLIIIAVGALTTALILNARQERESKVASEEYSTSRKNLKIATDAYADAALKASLATGEDKKSAEAAAKQAKVLAQQKLEDAQASLVAANASLELSRARQHEWATNQQLASGNPMTGGGALGLAQLVDAEELRINKSKANIIEATRAVTEASASIARSDAVIKAGKGGGTATVLTDLSAGAKDAKTTLDSLKSSLESVMSTLATPDENSDRTYAASVKTLTEAFHAGIISADAYTESVRRAKQVREDGYAVTAYKSPYELGKTDDRDIGVGPAEQALIDSASRVKDAYKAAWGEIGQAFKGAAQEWVYTGQLNWKRLTVDLLDNWKSVMSVLTDLWNNAQAGMQAAKAAGGSGGIFDAISGILKGLPGHANGTLSSPGGWHWVGERGPELLNMKSGAQVLNQSQLAAALGGGGGSGGPPVFRFDLRGAVLTDDLLKQMNAIGANYGQQAAVAGAQGGASLAGVNQADRERWKLK